MGYLETNGLPQLLISLTAYILFGPGFLFLVTINELARLFVSIRLRVNYGEYISLIPYGSEAIWALKRPNRTTMSVAIFKIDKQLPLERVKQTLNDVVLPAKSSNGDQVYLKLKNTLVVKYGYACWKKIGEKFNLDEHVRSLPGDKVYSKAELKKLINDWFQDMSEERPQWEFIIVPRFVDNADESETCLFICRIHHAYMDGMCFAMMFWTELPLNGSPPCAYYAWTKLIDVEVIREIRKKLNNPSLTSLIVNAYVAAAKEVLPVGRVPDLLRVMELCAFLPYPIDCLQNRIATFYYGINSLQPDFERISATKKESWKAMTGPWIPTTYSLIRLFGRFPTRAILMDSGTALELIGFPANPTDTGTLIFCASYNNSIKITGQTRSDYLTEKEFEDILERIPGIIHEWAHKLKDDEVEGIFDVPINP
ncbi:unnamed protein product [Orchesella dallaii]|uniref:Diacylglycerol O-acyltransferase n=1 Tax=Orchesella dallaii TaxID=48710 RepID=A0ABP1QM30_9HEXA